jgi:hypothetical protein
VTRRTKGALWLLIAPTVLIIVAFLLFAVINFVFNPTTQLPADGEAFAPTPIGITIVNILLFVMGSVSVLTWLPALIIGIVLLATTKK